MSVLSNHRPEAYADPVCDNCGQPIEYVEDYGWYCGNCTPQRLRSITPKPAAVLNDRHQVLYRLADVTHASPELKSRAVAEQVAEACKADPRMSGIRIVRASELLIAEQVEEDPPVAWQVTWRKGILPQLSPVMLAALRDGLLSDDVGIIQGATCSPPPLECVRDWDLVGADPITYAAWRAGVVQTVGEAEAWFARMCNRADELLGEPGGCRWFLNWWDETGRTEARKALAAEIGQTVAQAEGGAA